MLAKLSLPVKSLKRTRIGSITDRGLGIGKSRALIGTEVAYLKNATAGESADTQLTMKNKAGF
jgi:16S rRNA U516 pseudouridylate synthase RsuA-like enzyme